MRLYGPGWRKTPGEIFFVEFYKGQVIRLEIRDPVVRLGAYDRSWANANYISRTKKLNVL